MRTTIDIPDEILRRAKSTAALRGMKLKELVALFIEQGLESTATPVARGHKRPLPEVLPRTGTPVPSLSSAQIEELLLQEDLKRIGDDRST